MSSTVFPPGVYAASLTWFSEGEGQPLDLDIQTRHLKYLIESGITGSESILPFRMKYFYMLTYPTVVVAGSNGEAVALNTDERLRLVSLTREVASKLNRHDLPVIMGTVGQTTQEIARQIRAASEAGANFGLVLTPSYFHFAMGAEAITQFFTDVSQIYLIVFNHKLNHCR